MWLKRKKTVKGTAKARFVGLVQLVWLFSATAGASGDDIYVGNTANYVVKINSCGHGSVFAPVLVDSNSPVGLAFDNNGNLYVAYNSGCASKIEKYDSCGNGTLFAFWRSGVEVCFPMGLAFDGSGNLYVANFRDDLIQRFDPSGHSSVFANSGLYTPSGLAFDSSGNLYVANLWKSTIVKIDSSGHSSVFATANSGVDFPNGIAVDSDDNVYVANNSKSGSAAATILKFDPSGHVSVFATARSGLAGPIGLAFDSAGFLYVANVGNNTIVKFDSNGNGSLFADASAGLRGPYFIAARRTKLSITLLGNDLLTNECHTAFSDPGATASEGGRSNITVIAADLQDASGTLMSTSGVAVLVADSGNNGFEDLQSAFPLSFGATWGADDRVVGLWNLQDSYDNYWGQPGGLADQAVVFYTGGITSNQTLQLYWFPSLTIASNTLGITYYGKYTDTNSPPINGSGVWETPAACTAAELLFFTQSENGSSPDAAGLATNLTVESLIWSFTGGPTSGTEPLAVTGLGGATVARDGADLSSNIVVSGTVNARAPGTYTLAYTVVDEAGDCAAATRTVVVVDTTAPVIDGVGVDKAVLWPPNRKLVDVTVNYVARDACGDVDCSLSVTSNEPVVGTGTGDAAPDWVIVDAHHVLLRAERAGEGNGRDYTIRITCTDSSGNMSSEAVDVTVPKSQRK